jgi:hypothetical protein
MTSSASVVSPQHHRRENIKSAPFLAPEGRAGLQPFAKTSGPFRTTVGQTADGEGAWSVPAPPPVLNQFQINRDRAIPLSRVALYKSVNVLLRRVTP